MKLLFIADTIDGSTLSEPALWLGELAVHWKARGHDIEVVCLQAPEDGVPLEVPAGVTVHRPGPGGFEAAFGEALGREPHVIHVATGGPFGPRVVEILRELPVLLDVHGFWPICPAGDLLRRPRLQACGEHFPFRGCGECAGLARLRAMDDCVQVVTGATIVLAHSAFNRVRLNAGLGRAIDLLDYGVDTARFRPDPEPPRSAGVMEMFATRDRPRALFLGPPTHARGAGRLIDILVAASARMPEVEFVVAGRDPENPDWDGVVRVEAQELGLAKNLRVLPSVPVNDLPALYASCQVAIAPSIGNEAGGLFALQALATGLPIVASPLGALQDLVRQGEEGLLIPARDTAGFANGVCAMLVDPHARLAFGEAARLSAVEKHDFERTTFALEELYHRLAEFGRRAAA